MPNLAPSFVQGATAGQAIQQAQQRTQAMQLANYRTLQTIQDNQKFAQLMSSMATQEGTKEGAQPRSPSDQLMQMGLAATRAGLPQGIPLLNQAIGMQLKTAQAAADTTRAQAAQTRATVAAKKQQLAQYEQMMAPAAGMLAGVHDQGSWDAFTHYMAAHFNDQEFLGTPYNPQTVQQLQFEYEGAKTAIQAAHVKLDDAMKQADLQERQRHDQVLERLASARVAAQRVTAQASQARARLAEERERRLEKTGGGRAVNPPPMQMQMQAEQVIKNSFPDMASGDLEQLSFSVSSEAMALLKKNPGMDAQQALMQAFQDQKDTNVLIQPRGFFGTNKPTFNPYGANVPETFKSPQDVVEAFKAGKIPRQEAEQFLRAMGAH